MNQYHTNMLDERKKQHDYFKETSATKATLPN
jgi:hypothetical protein